MTRCARCCLNYSVRTVNLILNLFGVGMIIYSLWLQKKWNEGVAELPTTENLPRPWFIYTCLGVGIAVCLSTLFGHMVANCINNSTLCIYIVSVCSLLFMEVAVVVAIFFKYNWREKIADYIDENHQKFESFVAFHLKLCQLITLMILVAQINVIGLAIVLWAVGTEPVIHSHGPPDMTDFTRSFLVGPNILMPNGSRQTQTCIRCENLLVDNPIRSFLSYIKAVFRVHFLRTTVS